MTCGNGVGLGGRRPRSTSSGSTATRSTLAADSAAVRGPAGRGRRRRRRGPATSSERWPSSVRRPSASTAPATPSLRVRCPANADRRLPGHDHAQADPPQARDGVAVRREAEEERRAQRDRSRQLLPGRRARAPRSRSSFRATAAGASCASARSAAASTSRTIGEDGTRTVTTGELTLKAPKEPKVMIAAQPRGARASRHPGAWRWPASPPTPRRPRSRCAASPPTPSSRPTSTRR